MSIIFIALLFFIVDNDECSNNETNICEELCINTNGSFYCGCSTPGYTLQSNGTACQSELVSLPRAHAQGGKVIGCVVVVSTKIAISRDVGV